MVNNEFKPNQVTVDVAIRSLCSVGRVYYVVLLVKEFSLKHSKPDIFTYNFLVKSLCKSRILNSVYSFINEMKNIFNIKPDLVTCTILIDNVCNAKNICEADRLVVVLKECGLKPDAFMYHTIMKGYCMLSKGIEAVRIYKQMKEEGVLPDLVMYNTLKLNYMG
jgi:pentatricopeptide repeat protein